MLVLILPTERVMVVGPFFTNHHVVLGETVGSVSDAAPPRPLPAHYSLAVLRMRACESSVCSCRADFFSSSSAIETRITAPTLSQASASLPSLYPAPAARFCQLQAHPALAWYGVGGEMAGKHKEIRQEVREREQIWESGR